MFNLTLKMKINFVRNLYSSYSFFYYQNLINLLILQRPSSGLLDLLKETNLFSVLTISLFFMMIKTISFNNTIKALTCITGIFYTTMEK